MKNLQYIASQSLTTWNIVVVFSGLWLRYLKGKGLIRFMLGVVASIVYIYVLINFLILHFNLLKTYWQNFLQ